jgi:hypothetical protein
LLVHRGEALLAPLVHGVHRGEDPVDVLTGRQLVPRRSDGVHQGIRDLLAPTLGGGTVQGDTTTFLDGHGRTSLPYGQRSASNLTCGSV